MLKFRQYRGPYSPVLAVNVKGEYKRDKRNWPSAQHPLLWQRA